MLQRGRFFLLIGVCLVAFLFLALVSTPVHSVEEIEPGEVFAGATVTHSAPNGPDDARGHVSEQDEEAVRPLVSLHDGGATGAQDEEPQRPAGLGSPRASAIAGHRNPVHFFNRPTREGNEGVAGDGEDAVDPVQSGEDDLDYDNLDWMTDSDLEEVIAWEEERGGEATAEEAYCERLRLILEGEVAQYLGKERWRRYNHTALASFPRSGNTWTRIVLQEMTGVVSGSVYHDKLAPEPLSEIPGTEDVFIVKTHKDSLQFHVRQSGAREESSEVATFDAVILLVRNPFDAVMSDLNHSFSHTFSGTLAHLTSQMRSHAKDRFSDWQRSVHAWMDHYTRSDIPFLLVRYEDIIRSPKRSFSDMLMFLGAAVDEEKVDCILDATSCERHPESCRLGKVGSSLDVWDRTTIEEQSVLLEKELALFGYQVSLRDDLPTLTVLPMMERTQGQEEEVWDTEDIRECLRESKPNILFILSDDQRSDAIGYMNPLIRTPVLDSLSRSGVTYMAAHASTPFCSPSRMAILTGKREQRSGVWSGKQSSQLWPKIMGELGVRTSMSGKYHTDLGTPLASAGFTSYTGVFDGGMHDYSSIPVASSRDKKAKPTAMHDSPTRVFTDATIEELSVALASGERFAHWLCYTAPHDPRVPNPIAYREEYQRTGITLPGDWAEEPLFDPGTVTTIRQELMYPRPLDREEWRGVEIPGYYGLVSQMDEQIGRVVTFLKERNAFNNTLIIFASDNGLMMGSHGLVAKQYMYEESLRVPMFIRGPCVAEGKVSYATVDVLDIFPTLVDVAGGAVKALDVDGKSLLPTLHPTAETDLEFRGELLCSYRNSFAAIKTSRWKLAHNLLVDKVELFDLEADPTEENDLAGSLSYAEVQAQLEERLTALLQEIEDKT